MPTAIISAFTIHPYSLNVYLLFFTYQYYDCLQENLLRSWPKIIMQIFLFTRTLGSFDRFCLINVYCRITSTYLLNREGDPFPNPSIKILGSYKFLYTQIVYDFLGDNYIISVISFNNKSYLIIGTHLYLCFYISINMALNLQ